MELVKSMPNVTVMGRFNLDLACYAAEGEPIFDVADCAAWIGTLR